MVTLVINHATTNAPSENHPHEHRPAPVETKPSPERVAMGPVTVNGVPIPRKAIAAEVQNFPAPNPGAGWRAATRALVIRELLLQEARRLEIPVEQKADPDGRLETDEEAVIRALIEREVRTPSADEETLRRYYDRNRSRFTTPPLFEADHILIAARRDDVVPFARARDKAVALAALLARQPERFGEIARENSDCTSAALGGSLGQISPGDTTPEFEAALMKLKEGEISQPVETRYGVHLIAMRRRIDGRELPFEAVRDRIENYLNERVRAQASAQYISLLIGRADIKGIALAGADSPLVQ